MPQKKITHLICRALSNRTGQTNEKKDCFDLLPSTYEIFSWTYLPSHPRMIQVANESFDFENPQASATRSSCWATPTCHIQTSKSGSDPTWVQSRAAEKMNFIPQTTKIAKENHRLFNGRYIFKLLFLHCLPLLFRGVISCKVAWKHFEGRNCLEEWQIIPGWLKGFVLITRSVIIDSKRTP